MDVKRSPLVNGFAANLVAGAVAMVITGTADAAPAKRRPRTKTAAPAKPRMSNSQLLAALLSANTYSTSALETCSPRKFKDLAIALNANREWLDVPQGEFETSEAFAQRKNQHSEALAADSILLCDDLSDNEDAPFKYNADKQRFEGNFSADHNVWRDTKQLGSYRAKTRMGIPMTVKASAEFEYNVSLKFRENSSGCISGTYYNTYFVPVPLADAPLTKAVGKIAYIARLTGPYVSYVESSDTASLDDPYEIHSFTITETAKLEKVLIVGSGGQVIWQCAVE